MYFKRKNEVKDIDFTSIKFPIVLIGTEYKSGKSYSIITRIRNGILSKILKPVEEDNRIYFKRKMRCKADVTNLCDKIINSNNLEGIVLTSVDGTFKVKYLGIYPF